MTAHYPIYFMTSTDATNQRADRWLSQKLPQFSRSQIQEALKNQSITIDGKPVTKVNQKLVAEQVISGCVTAFVQAQDAPQNLDIAPMYEDDHILIMNKPAGLVTHPGHGNHDHTLLNGILHISPQNSHLPKSGLVHRLDKDTSGLLLCAKTSEAYHKCVEMMQKREISRIYDAFCWGLPQPPNGTIDAPIGRHPQHRTKMAINIQGKHAITHYQLTQSYGVASLIECRLETGRTHQIRVHCQAKGFPIVGDPTYQQQSWRHNTKKDVQEIIDYAKNMGRQALHARQLKFSHPLTDKLMDFQAPWPEDMTKLQQLLETL